MICHFVRRKCFTCVFGFCRCPSGALALHLCVVVNWALSSLLSHHLFLPVVSSSVPGPCRWPPDATFGLLLGLFVVCGLALLGLLAFVSWKLRRAARQPAKTRCSDPSLSPERHPLQPPLPPSPQQQSVTMATEKVKDPVGSMGFLEAAVKISHTSPDIPTDVQLSMREHFLRRTQRMQRQTTEPASSTRSVTCTCV